ncbi:hypothetical protein BKH43_08215 [Helicobacter sp. 13S00401-1]|uniref:hypothetical protein n=1 Tax=Helicobacter sp. 13S00401-1 TaxID=1905758 RepID=UPI000BA594DD|nr:hypothetical protein [Helicobacter sp. 13S00401-1]PAF47399.1 hypothetical protein BKH43_08215 [Helicobacter sp. 13S00401-1]
MKEVTKQAYKKATNKATRIILATTLIASFSSMAMAAEGHKRLRSSEVRSETSSNDINGVRFLLGAGVGTGVSATSENGGFTLSTPNAGVDAKLKLGTGIFTTTRNSTLGLQATIGVGANSLGASSNFNPQYSLNLDFIQAFKVGASGYVKLGYILGAGLAIRTHDNVNSGSGNSNTVIGAAVAIGGQDLIDKFNTANAQANTYASNALTQFNSGNITQGIQSYQNAQKELSEASEYSGLWRSRYMGSYASSAPSFDRSTATSAIANAKAAAISNTTSQISTVTTTANEAKTLAGDPNNTSNIQQASAKIQQASSELSTAKNNLQALQNAGLISSDVYTSTVKPGDDALTTAKNTLTTSGTIGAQAAQIVTLQQQLTDAEGAAKASNDNNAKQLQAQAQKIATLQQQLEDMNKKAIAAANADRQRANRNANNTPTILPTAKAGLIAFFGKHQAVSLEYQYYFRNTVQGMASSDISLNYTYYFGGK